MKWITGLYMSLLPIPLESKIGYRQSQNLYLAMLLTELGVVMVLYFDKIKAWGLQESIRKETYQD